MGILKACFAVGVILLFVLPGGAQDTNCMTADCHKEFKDFKMLHAPVEDDCTTCHESTGKHKFKPPDARESCLECHDDKNQGKQVHEIMSSSDCTDCHDPHGGKHKALLKAARVDTLCFECHDKEPMEHKFIHGPNASGNCTLCHDAHASEHAPLLVADKAVICTRCHTDKDYSGENMKIHSPMKEGCSGCHSSHSSAHKYQLLKSPDNLCGKCHEKIAKKAAETKYKHKVLEQDKKCFNCHDPHGSVFENNLRVSPLKLCLDCHNKPIIGTDGKDYNIYRIVKNNPHKHGPIEDGNCSGCHDPHGSNFYKLLTDEFPKEFYTSYDTGKYGICFQCHENSLAKTAKTTTLTNFRDGGRNLHFVHVNLRKGRTCRACHEIHAGTQAKHVREETPFGTWSIPIGFKIQKDGGSCAPGCHKPFTYSRVKGGAGQ